MKKHVFDPLDMNDTGFRIPRENIDRFADMYISTQGRGDNAFMNVSDQMGSGKIYRTKNTFDVPSRFYYGGSEGLITTACDYYKFATCLCNNGLALNGKQIITKDTAEMMTTNQLPELIKQIPEILTKEDLYNVRKNGSTANINDIELDYFMDPITLKQMGMRGMQFGLGVSILHKPFPDGFGNVGEYGWGGAGSTVYFCDKKEKIVVVFMTELLQGRLNMKRRIKECLYGVSFPKKSRSTKARL